MILFLRFILFYFTCIKHAFVAFRFAKVGEYPSTISIRSKQNQTHFCGGSLVDTIHAITAACCLYPIKDNTSGFEIMGGDIYLYESLTNSVKPSFALSRVSRQGGPTLSGIDCQIVGWGSRNNMKGPSSLLSNKLMVTDVVVAYSNVDIHNQNELCLTIKLTRKSCRKCTTIPKLCQGDYGGAMLCNGNLAAIITSTSICNGNNEPKVLTEISQYNTWIDRITSNPVYYSCTKKTIMCVVEFLTLWSVMLLFL
ncbi:trypsin-3-like isoform X2 [Hermetia illucens]|uniref:trypsin-3-like isoform X2 n=1 Tax=Hermetia illucens TaxID=343691 RepID=UPI0018CBF4C4|nr:trypsin-3-like isoform X2 [Hermetia illucens]